MTSGTPRVRGRNVFVVVVVKPTVFFGTGD